MNQPSFERIIQIGSGYSAAKVLLSAVGLGLFTELAAQPMTAAQIAERFGLVPRPALRLPRRPGLAEAARPRRGRTRGPLRQHRRDGALPRREQPDLPRRPAEDLGSAQLPLLGGSDRGPADRSGPERIKYTGTSFFETMYAEPSRLEAFMSAMDSSSRVNFELLAERFPFDRYRIAVRCRRGRRRAVPDRRQPAPTPSDHQLGSAQGDQDRGPEDRRRGSRRPGARTGGQLLTDPLPSADVITMGMILHDWDLERKKLLVAKAYEALPEGGRSSSSNRSSTTPGGRTPSG